jgi:ketosteroid isomerase-like protein
MIRAHLHGTFGAAVRLTEFREVVVHETTDPHLIIAEHDIAGTATASGHSCVISNIVVLEVRDGRVTRQRDYLDVLAAAHAGGRLPALLSGR